MSIITRNEAVWKLKNVQAKISLAVTAVRDGNWVAGAEEAADAMGQLEAVLKHLDEAAEEVPIDAAHPKDVSRFSSPGAGSSSYGRPPVVSSSCASATYSQAPPPPLKKVTSTPPRRVIVPPPPIPEPQVIVPPAPEPPPQFEPARVSIFPVEYDGVPSTTFDFERMLDVDDRDPEVIRTQQLFNSLPDATRRVLIDQYNKTRKPVTCKIRTEAAG